MTCGIYKLTFPSGRFYIGKSIDISKRWEQHANDMRSGKHTKKLQNEFNIYGTYTQEVLFECHQDHIDIMEESYIARLQPPLNGTYPKDRLDVIADTELGTFLSYMNIGTLQHIEQLHNTKNKVVELETSIKKQESLVAKLSTKRTKEELAADIKGKIKELEKEVYTLNHSLSISKETRAELFAENCRLLSYKNLPWYKKIFN
jgi:hypothetical protein